MNRTLLNGQNGKPMITFAERAGVDFQISKKEIGRGASCIVYHAVGSDNTEHLLKEYYPKHLELVRDSSGHIVVPEYKKEFFEQGLVHFRAGCERQKSIRLSNEGLKNFTCNVQGYYAANGTEYIDMTCFNGQTYDHVQEKSVYSLMLRMRTLAQVVGNYHMAGLLHLDIKPENIYVRPESETIEDVMLFDFDSVTPMNEIVISKALSCTKTWAAPEQILPEKRMSICPATDLYAIGEIIFVQLFGRHSTSAEHRSFVTEYAYDYKAEIFKDMNPKVFPLLDDLLCHTICGVVGRRYQSAEELIAKLDEIIEIANPQKPYLHKIIPYVQQHFVGRTCEIDTLHKLLSKESVVFVSGIGGIGKSELVKQYAKKYADYYDTITSVAFDTDISTTIQNADNCPYNVKRHRDECPEEFFVRKVEKLQKLCTSKTLIIVDNFDVVDDPHIQVLFELGCKVLVTTRTNFADTYTQVTIEALEDPFEVFQKHYQKPLGTEERVCVDRIIDSVCGHTLTVELLAKQMMAGRVRPDSMLAKLQEAGLSGTGKEKVRIIDKYGEISSKSTNEHIRALFDLSGLDECEKHILVNLSLIPYSGISTELFHDWCELNDYDGINGLVVEGWVRQDKEKDFISLHPLVSDILHDIINTEDIAIFLSRFTEDLTDDDTGEVILRVCPFSFANTVASMFLALFQKKKLIPTEESVHCIGKIGDFFFEQGLLDSAEQSFCTQQELYRTLNLSNAYLALVISNSFALLYDKQGELYGKRELSEKALCYLKECLLIVEEPQNNMTEYIGTVSGNIGSIYHTLKDYENAESYYKKALEHSDRYSFCTDIGVLYENQGNYRKALEMHQEAMKRAVKYKEPELVIALIEHNMAVSYKRLGQLNDAVTHCEEALLIRGKYLDSGASYDFALTKSLLGQIYVELGDTDLIQDAERLLQEALFSLERIVGSKHFEYEKVLGILNSFFKKDFANNIL